ncbi:MAG TPA: hypothetical protein VM734_33375 [Kofleriaceae bacterium]|nr:hypothetical protein [Kofleriaceae bacterium]
MRSALAPRALLRRTFAPSALLAAHPPRLQHPHKRLCFDLACPAGAGHDGTIELTRWAALALPAEVALHDTAVTVVEGVYDYPAASDGVWHVNFADPQLFVAYGSALLAQDELQALEHPTLGSLREALLAEGQPALTEENGHATPVLVAGVERRCELATAPDPAAGRLYGLYGNRFARASVDELRAALTVLAPPTVSNLIAIAAPAGGRGRYQDRQLAQILTTAVTGFAAAVAESHRRWSGGAVEIRTGFWGCGAFGGNRVVMALLQIVAARLAGVDRVRFYAFDADGARAAAAAQADLDAILAARPADEPLTELIERVADLGHVWGTSDGT